MEPLGYFAYEVSGANQPRCGRFMPAAMKKGRADSWVAAYSSSATTFVATRPSGRQSSGHAGADHAGFAFLSVIAPSASRHARHSSLCTQPLPLG